MNFLIIIKQKSLTYASENYTCRNDIQNELTKIHDRVTELKISLNLQDVDSIPHNGGRSNHNIFSESGIKLRAPTFSGVSKERPIQFLKPLNSYLDIYQVQGKKCLCVIAQCLTC